MKVDNLTLERIFQSKRYLIQDFQREYTWQIHNTKGKSKSNKCVRFNSEPHDSLNIS